MASSPHWHHCACPDPVVPASSQTEQILIPGSRSVMLRVRARVPASARENGGHETRVLCAQQGPTADAAQRKGAVGEVGGGLQRLQGAPLE